MTTFRQVKTMAKTFEYDYLRLGRDVTDKQRNFYYFYAFDAALSYRNMVWSADKLFWWKMIVTAIRMSNAYYIENTKHTLYILED